MGPRIILRGAIPIDSNIGGSGHRPLFGEVVSWSFVGVLSFLAVFLFFLRAKAMLLGCRGVLGGTTAGGARYYRS